MTTATITPAEEAIAITNRPHLSWSQINAYQMCPKKFQLQYVDRLEPEFTPQALAFGCAIHEAIASHFEQVMAGGKDRTVDELMRVFSETLDDRNVPVLYKKDDDEQSLMGLATRMLESFLASDAAQPSGELISIEDEVTGELAPDLPPLLARLDVVEHTDAGLIIRDFKTTRSAWNESKVSESAGQLLLYAEVASQRLGTDPANTRLEFVTITKAKTPKVQTHTVPYSVDAAERTKSLVVDVWDAISKGAFPARPSWACSSCPFASHCPAVSNL